MAISLKEAHSLDHLIFVPSGENPLKQGKKKASRKDRLNMLKIALKGISDVSISTDELDREGPSYMIDTVRHLQKKHPKTKFFLLIGEDIAGQLNQWKHYPELKKAATFLVAKRGGNTSSVPLFDVSSTVIRERLQKGQFVGHLLDKKVLQYIQKHGVYAYPKKAK